MNGNDLSWLWPFTHLGTALFFLLLGWRFGREATGRPMFAFPVAPTPETSAGEEVDPWALAAAGRPETGGWIETRRSPGPASDGCSEITS